MARSTSPWRRSNSTTRNDPPRQPWLASRPHAAARSFAGQHRLAAVGGACGGAIAKPGWIATVLRSYETEKKRAMPPPIQSPESPPTTERAPRASSVGGKRILLADDSPQIRESLGKLLRQAGYHVTPVARGASALDRAAGEDFDLLVLDLNMPGLGGWQAMDHLSRLKPELPVILITALPKPREWARAGSQALMEKPLDPPLLLRTISEFTSRSTPNPAPARPQPGAGFSFNPAPNPPFEFFEPHVWKTGGP